MRKKKEFHKKTEVISPKGRECPRGEKRRRPKQKKKGKKTKKKQKTKKRFWQTAWHRKELAACRTAASVPSPRTSNRKSNG